MKLLGRNILKNLHKNDVLDSWLNAWSCEIIHARWWSETDVFKQFPQVKQLDGNLFSFETKPKMYCINVQIAFFPIGVVLITDIELAENE